MKLASLAIAVLLSAADGGSAVDPRIGRPLPQVKLDKLGGGSVSTQDEPGKWEVLVFGASWCPGTNRVLTLLKDYAPKLGAAGVSLYAVDIDDDAEAAASWSRRRASFLPILLDKQGQLATPLVPPEGRDPPRLRLLATIVVRDPAGKIAFVNTCSQMPCEKETQALAAFLAAHAGVH